MRTGRAVGGALATGLMDQAFGDADVAIDRGDYFRDRDRGRKAGQPIPAGGAARRGYEPGMGQRLQQLGNSRLRQPRRGRYRSGIGLTIRMRGQMRGDNDAVIGEFAENDHCEAEPDGQRSKQSLRFRFGQFGPDRYAIDCLPEGRVKSEASG